MKVSVHKGLGGSMSWVVGLPNKSYMNWDQSEVQIQIFFPHTNNAHPWIRYTHEISGTQFNNLTPLLSDGIVSTNINIPLEAAILHGVLTSSVAKHFGSSYLEWWNDWMNFESI
jgi:hypothetical protein